MRRQLTIGVTAAVAIVSMHANSVPAGAAIDADSETAAAVRSCGELFSRPGNDPSGLWKRLSQPGGPVVKVRFKSVPNNGAGTGTGRVGKDGSRIFWDPTHDIVVDGVVAGRCEVLIHELQHADDNSKLSDDELNKKCNGIPNAEWRAVAAQNALRRALGKTSMRKSYHGKKFDAPSFDNCRKGGSPKPVVAALPNSVFGDPHIATSDGLLYDLQQVGEFTAFTSKAAVAPRVQLRFSPVAGSSGASQVSAVAIGDRGQRITFAADDPTAITVIDGTKRQDVTVDEGSDRDLGGKVTLAAEESAEGFSGNAYWLRWGDGSTLRVDSTRHWGLRVSFEPSDEARSAEPRGLLGTFDGNADDDLVRPDGRVVPSDAAPATVRSDFGDAWRITQSDSLFAYESGQSTETFTDRAFPRAELQFPAETTDQARQVCRDAGITAETFLAACVFDVSITGNPALAAAAAAVARDVVGRGAAGSRRPDQIPVTADSGPLRDGSRVVDAITDPQQSKRFDLEIGDATTFYIADWQGTTDRCDRTFHINFVDVSHGNSPCTGHILTFGRNLTNSETK